MKENQEQNRPRKEPFVKPELRAVRYEPREVVLGACKAGPLTSGSSPSGCNLCGSLIGS